MLLSIILPVYNGALYIRQCVDRIQESMTFDDYELVIIDDGSSDETAAVAVSLSDNNEHIKYLRHDNHGVSYSRNRGIVNAEGKWIQFMDVDDIICPQLYRQIQPALHSKAQLIVFDYDFCSAGKASFNGGHFSEEVTSDVLKRHLFLGRYSGFVWDKIYNREYVMSNKIAFDTDLKYHEDCLFNYKFLAGAPSVLYIRKTLYTHNVNANSVMSRFGSSDMFDYGYLRVLDAFEEMLGSEPHGALEDDTALILYSYNNYIQRILSRMQVCRNVPREEISKLERLSRTVVQKMPLRFRALSMLKYIKMKLK